MTGILSLITYSPLVGLLAILALRVFAKNDEKAAGAARWIALATTLATLALSVVLVAGFDPANQVTNWRADRGVSPNNPAGTTFSVLVPARPAPIGAN